MADTVCEVPAAERHHRCQQVVALPKEKAAEPKNADREVGVSHLELKGAVRPSDLLRDKRTEEQVGNEPVEAGDAHHPERDPEQRSFRPTAEGDLLSGLQDTQQQGQ